MRFPECLSVARHMALLCAAVAFSALADDLCNTYIVDRTVEVSPGARKNKAFPMAEGSALCDLHLMAKAPWRIRSSHIALRDDKTLWFKVSDREYIIASGYAPNEYVVVRGELEKPGGSGKEAEERPQFQVTVPKVDLQWAAKHGEASQEEKEDSVPSVIMVSEDPNDFGTLIVCAPKDDFQLSNPRVTLTWAPANAVKVFKGAAEVGSGASWLLMAGTQLELSVKAVRPEADVKFTLKGEPDVVSHERAVDYVRAMCAKVEFVTPAGDPVKDPVDGGDGQNEFTFSTANPGVLTINLKARVTPVAAAALMVNDCRFGVEAVGNSKMEWSKDNKGGKAAFVGGFLTATVKFIGLPEKNDAFGKKIAMLLWNGRKCDEENYEVFFPKNETNHPCTPSNSNWPNWMFYWLQTVEPLGSPAPNFVYGASSYFTPGTKTITLSDGDAGSYDAPYGANNTLCGIDNFAWTVIHESQHYKDWLDLWSNNYTNWYMSHRGGVAPDDDKDADNIPNRVEDVNLNKTYDLGDLYDWSVDNTPTAGRPPEIVDDFEDWNCQRHKNVKGDHSKDWGDPGMQHKTRDKYND